MTLLAAYAFDEVGSTTVTDLSGNGFHATLTGTAAVQVAGGRQGGALGKTGANMLVLPSGLLAPSQSDNRTVMLDAKQNFTTWWIRWEDDGINSGTWGILNISSAMSVQARRASDSSQLSPRPNGPLPTNTEWHHYAATYERATGDCKIYRDGVLVPTTGTQSFADGTQLSTAADRINIAEWSNTGPALDNLRIYDELLDAAAIAALAGSPVGAAGRFLPFF